MAKPVAKRKENSNGNGNGNGSHSSTIISFRLPGDHFERLQTKFGQPENQVVGIQSEEQLLRKIAMDWVDGKLVYINPRDRKLNPVLEIGQ